MLNFEAARPTTTAPFQYTTEHLSSHAHRGTAVIIK